MFERNVLDEQCEKMYYKYKIQIKGGVKDRLNAK